MVRRYDDWEIDMMADIIYGEYFREASLKAQSSGGKAWKGDPMGNPFRLGLVKALRAVEPDEEG